MEPFENFEKGELTDRELDAILPEWAAPQIPAGMKAKLFAKPWWRRAWGASIRVPAPVACAVAVVLAAGAVRLASRPEAAPRVVVRTERVNVPVVEERIVYRDRPVAEIAWRPVSELRPKIIRRRNN